MCSIFFPLSFNLDVNGLHNSHGGVWIGMALNCFFNKQSQVKLQGGNGSE